MPFADVLGQEPAKRLLAAALREERLAHTYLFHGPDGVGKVTLARSLFRAVLCGAAPGEGCRACSACLRIERDVHPDVHVLFVPPDKRSLPVDTVRELIAETSRKPVEGSFRFFLVDDAHKLGLESANGLLKTLEEPPVRTILILTALRPESVMRTVVSRCQSVRFFRLPVSLIERALLDRGAAPDVATARAAARLFEGSLGETEHALRSGLFLARESLVGAIGEAAEGSSLSAAEHFLETLLELESKKSDSREERRRTIRSGFRLAAAALRDAAIIAAGLAAGDTRLLLPDQASRTRAVGQRLGAGGSADSAAAAARAAEQIDRNLREELIVETFFLEIAAAAEQPFVKLWET